MTRAVLELTACVGMCFGVAALGSVLIGPSITGCCAGLDKPSWTPPNSVFGPVWPLLYLMMAVALWLVWRKAGLSAGAVPLALFMLQLACNVAWSVLFFGMRMPDAAFTDIVLLWCLILVTVVTFWRVAPMAGVLRLPYLAWVTLAAALNWAIWRMNP